MKVLNYGSLNIDYVYKLIQFVKPGETISSQELKIVCGGKGLNQSIALARCGAEVFHAGNVGLKDGTILLDKLSSFGIDTNYIEKYDCPSGHAIIQVDNAGQNCIILYGGANHKVTKEQVNNVLSQFDSNDIIVLQNEINLLDYIIQRAYEKGMRIALNPSPIGEYIYELPIEKVSYLFVNEIEAAELVGGEADGDVLEQLSVKYPETVIILTKGKDGVEVRCGNKIYRHRVYDIEVVDTTAAGDTFTGYFLASCIKDKEMDECLELASKAASICVSRRGAADSIPCLREVVEAKLNLK